VTLVGTFPAPSLRLEGQTVILAGEWTLAAMLPRLSQLESALAKAAGTAQAWNFSEVTRIDSAAAALFWQTWKRTWPAQVEISEGLRHILERAAAVPDSPPPPPARTKTPVELAGLFVLRFLHNAFGVVTLFGQLLLDALHILRHPRDLPAREFSATLFKSGASALPVSALVGFLIGITISYLSAIQLRIFGADIFIVNILGISIVRELGPVLVAVLVAGRSGSSMTAQIGVMRVTEEIDALATMGISRTLRIVLPKVAALSVAMPLLVVWTSAAALSGGMVAAYLQLGLSPEYFLDSLPRAVPLANVWIGLGKGVAFGFTIALIACHFGLHVRPNTESLSAHTTSSVVSAITSVIVIDAIFAILTRRVGLPQL
jgi:phospholipid/cholesterol/gamma-HCH transport system permease protein